MPFITVGTLGTTPGAVDALIAHLTRRSDLLAELGCLAYEVGAHEEEPDTVVVMEMWTSREAHRASLSHPEVQAAIAEARPLLSGTFGGLRFDAVGSPMRD